MIALIERYMAAGTMTCTETRMTKPSHIMIVPPQLGPAQDRFELAERDFQFLSARSMVTVSVS